MRADIINFLTEAAAASALVFIPIFSRLSDIYGRKKFLFLGLIASAISFPLQAFASTPFQLLLARVLVGFCTVIFPTALIAHIYDLNKKIGKFMAFGSLGWAIGQFLAGLIALYWKIFFLGSFFFILAFLLALKMEIPKVSFPVPLIPLKIIKNNFLVYLSFFLRHFGANMVWIIFPLFFDFFWNLKILDRNYLFCQFILPIFDHAPLR